MQPQAHPDSSGDLVAIWANWDSKDRSVDLCLCGRRTLVTAVTPLNGAALSPVNNLSDKLQPAFVE